MTADQLIDALGRKSGQEGLRLNDKRALTLLLDERTPVTVEASEDGETIFVSAMLCRYPADDKRLALFDVLMEAHAFGVATNDAYFGTSRRAGKVVLSKRFRVSEVAEATFVDGIARFLDVLTFWKGKLKEAGL